MLPPVFASLADSERVKRARKGTMHAHACAYALAPHAISTFEHRMGDAMHPCRSHALWSRARARTRMRTHARVRARAGVGDDPNDRSPINHCEIPSWYRRKIGVHCNSWKGNDLQSPAKKRVALVFGAAQNFLLQNPNATNKEVVSAIGCSIRVVSKARVDLVARGLAVQPVADRWSQRKSTQWPLNDKPPGRGVGGLNEINPADPTDSNEVAVNADGDLAVVPIDELMRIVETVPGEKTVKWTDISPQEMAHRLSKIIRDTKVHPQIIIAAITAKNRIDLERRDKHALGPGGPLTQEDATVRLTLLDRAAGLAIATEAYTRAFGDVLTRTEAAHADPIGLGEEAAPAGRHDEAPAGPPQEVLGPDDVRERDSSGDPAPGA